MAKPKKKPAKKKDEAQTALAVVEQVIGGKLANQPKPPRDNRR